MKIALVIASLSGGGAERVFARLAKAFAEQGHVVTLITLDAVREGDYVVPNSVRRVALELVGLGGSLVAGLRNNLLRLRRLRAALVECAPDVVLSALSETNVLAVLACTGLRVPVIVTEHNDPRAFPLNRAWDALRRFTYPRAARLVGVSQGVCNYFDWLPEAQKVVIPNGIDMRELALPADGPADLPSVDARTIVALGRLAPAKGFDLLLHAFAAIAPAYPDWKLVIVGEGEERAALTNLIQALQLADRVFLPGFLKSPYRYIETAAFMVFPSRTEGFGLAIVEAFACGLPVVAFDCPTGPKDIIRDGIDGCLIPPGDIAQLAAAMSALIQDGELRAALAAAARQGARRFALEAVLPQWEQLFGALTGELRHDRVAGAPLGDQEVA